MIWLLIAIFFIIIITKFKRNLKLYNFKKNNNLINFKNKSLSIETNIERIYSRNNEKIASNPDINIKIGIYEKEESILIKTNLHRARLEKFKKSKLNGDFIFKDKNNNIYQYINGNKVYIK